MKSITWNGVDYVPLSELHKTYDQEWRYKFAGMAMQGLIAGTSDEFPPLHTVAALSVKYADALLEELKK